MDRSKALEQILGDLGFVYNDRNDVDVTLDEGGSELRGAGRVNVDPEPEEYLRDDIEGPNELRLLTDSLSHQVEHGRESDSERKRAIVKKYEREAPVVAGYVANIVEDAFVNKNRVDRFRGMQRTAAYSADKLMENESVLPDVSDMSREEQMVFGIIEIGIAGYVKGYDNCDDEVQEFFGFARQRIEMARSAVDPKRRNAINDQIVQKFIEVANDVERAEDVIQQNIDTLPTDPVPTISQQGSSTWQDNPDFEELSDTTDSEEEEEYEPEKLEYEEDPSGTEDLQIPEEMQEMLQQEMDDMQQMEQEQQQQQEQPSVPRWLKFLVAGAGLAGIAFLAYGVMTGLIPLWMAAAVIALLLLLAWLLSKLLNPPAGGSASSSASGAGGSQGANETEQESQGSDESGSSGESGEDSEEGESDESDDSDESSESEQNGRRSGDDTELGDHTDKDEQEEFGPEEESSGDTTSEEQGKTSQDVGSVDEQKDRMKDIEEMEEAADEIAQKAGDWFDVDENENYHEPDAEAINRFEAMQDMDTTDMSEMLEFRDSKLDHSVNPDRIRDAVSRSGLEDEIVEAFRQLKTRDRDVAARRGKKINVRNSVRRLSGDTSENRLYMKRQRAESGDRAIGVAVDMSGSMNLDKTRVALGSLKIATDIIGDDMVIHGFTTGMANDPSYERSTNVSTPLLTGPHESVEWEHLDLVTSGGGTPTGAGIASTRASLQRASKPEKVLICITDGHPNQNSLKGNSNGLSAADEALAEVRECERKGIKVIGMAIGSSDEDLMNKMFGDNWVHTEEDTLADDLVDIYRGQMKVA